MESFRKDIEGADERIGGFFEFKNIVVNRGNGVASFVDFWVFIKSSLHEDQWTKLRNLQTKSKLVEADKNNDDFIEMRNIQPYLQGYAQSIWYYAYLDPTFNQFSPQSSENNQIFYYQEGEISSGLLDSFGRLFDPNTEEISVGYFFLGSLSGKGIKYKNGTVISEGLWENGKLLQEE